MQRPPRITILLENHAYHNDPRIRPHAETLAQAGYQVTVISPRTKDNQPWVEQLNGIMVYRFPVTVSGGGVVGYLNEYIFATLFIFLLTKWVWLRRGMDILQLYDPPDVLFVAGIIPKLFGKKIIFDLSDLSPELYLSKFDRKDMFYRLLLLFERISCTIADHVIVVNETYYCLALERDKVPPQKLTIIRNGPDLNKINPVQQVRPLRERAGTLISYLGHMAKQDGVDHLLHALGHLDKMGYTDWYCMLVGSVDEPQGLEEIIKDLGIEDRVWFAGYQPLKRWLPILSTADICVEPAPANPMNEVSTMIKIMEYMALSKPVVAYDLTEHRVTAGNAALYAEPDNPRALAEQMVQLIDNPELGQKLGTIGRRRIEERLAWHHQRDKLLALYRSLTGYRNTAVDVQEVSAS